MRYLRLAIFLISCRPPEPLPPTDDLSALVCERGAQCGLVGPDQDEACQRCVDCFLELNGGRARWEPIISQRLDDSCADIRRIGEATKIWPCYRDRPHEIPAVTICKELYQ